MTPTHITHKQWIFQSVAPKLDYLTGTEKRKASQQFTKILKRPRASRSQEAQTVEFCNYKWWETSEKDKWKNWDHIQEIWVTTTENNQILKGIDLMAAQAK